MSNLIQKTHCFLLAIFESVYPLWGISVARAYLVFGDIEGKLDILRVECTRCDRKGRHSEGGWVDEPPKSSSRQINGAQTLRLDCWP